MPQGIPSFLNRPRYYPLVSPQTGTFSVLHNPTVSHIMASLDNIYIWWKEWYQDHCKWLGNFDSMVISWNTVIIFKCCLHYNDSMHLSIFLERRCFIWWNQQMQIFLNCWSSIFEVLKICCSTFWDTQYVFRLCIMVL